MARSLLSVHPMPGNPAAVQDESTQLYLGRHASRAALPGRPMPDPGRPPPTPREARRLPAPKAAAVLECARSIGGASDPAAAARIFCETIAELTASERVRFLLRDPRNGALWSPDGSGGRAAGDAGLTGFAARSGVPFAAARASESPLYRADLDDPPGDGSERIAVQPLLSAGAVIAVVSAVRSSAAPPYTPAARMVLSALAEECGPLLGSCLARHRAPAPATPRPAATPALLDVLPSWIRWSYRFLLAAAAFSAGATAMARVERHSSGPAIVEVGGVAVTAVEEATVAAVRVEPGARVRRGDLLVDLHSARETGELYRREVEHEERLAAFRRDPTDENARRALADAAALRERARTRLAQRSVRAPRDGIVSEIRVHSGLLLAPGQPIATVVDEAAQPTAVVLLPVRDRAALAPGMELVLELPGRGAIAGVIESVGSEVIAPDEARASLGPAKIGALSIAGPIVLVRARLGQRAAGGDALRDGMVGTGEVRVGSRTLLSLLVLGGDDR